MNLSVRQAFLTAATRYSSPESVAQNTDKIKTTTGSIEDTLCQQLNQKLVGQPASKEQAEQVDAFEKEVFQAVQNRHPSSIKDDSKLTVQFVAREQDEVFALGINVAGRGGLTAHIDPTPGEPGGNIYISDIGGPRLRWGHVVRQAPDHEYIISK